MPWSKEHMADKVIDLIPAGSCVNLGIGLPTLVAERMPKGRGIMIQSENGVFGVAGRPTEESVSPTLINAGKETIAITQGASFFDSALSFGMIRGEHVDFSILGGMEVDVERNLANWMVPGKKITGMGGAMDLVNGSKSVIIMMTHFDKSGNAKLKKRCTYPLTGRDVVDWVITDYGTFKPDGRKFEIFELAENITEKDADLPEF